MRRLGILAFLSVLAAGTAQGATLLGPLEYTGFDATTATDATKISPFAGLTFDYFYLEDFEDHVFDVPGVTPSPSGPGLAFVTSDAFAGSRDSVEGSPTVGDSWFAWGGTTTWTFDATVLEMLPTHVGIVWTDGQTSEITFQAYDENGDLILDAVTGQDSVKGHHADGSTNGTKAEDRFYGAINMGGISKITLSNAGGAAIEMDHLQYGKFSEQRLPEPTVLALGVLALLGLGFRRR